MRLFSKKKPDPVGGSAAAFERQTPSVGSSAQADEFHHAVAVPTVERARAFIFQILLAAIALAQGIAIYRMLPLKEVRPWVVEVNQQTGERRLDKEVATPVSAYKPSQAVLDREIFNFVRALYTLNADAVSIVEEGLAVAYATHARDRAAAEVREFTEREQPFQRMKTIPGLVRTVEKRTITYRDDAQVALVRFSTAERQRGQTAPIKRDFVMQVTYAMRPSNEPAEIERNPLGLYITHFDIQEDR